MWTRSVAGFVLTTAAFLCVPSVCLGQGIPAPAVSSQPMTLEEVVEAVKGGMPEDLIIARLKRVNKPFDLSPAEFTELRRLGVSETVMKYLIDPAQPYAPASAAAPVAAAAGGAAVGAITPQPSPSKPPTDPAVLKLPMEAGLYWLNDESPVQLELKPVVTSKQGGGKIRALLKKNNVVGSLAGASAKTKLPAGETTVYARLQFPVEDLVLVQLELDDGNRNLDFGTKPAKPTFPPEIVKQFETKDVGLGVVRLSLPPLKRGQYLFLILGSGEEKKATLGKGWEFGVE